MIINIYIYIYIIPGIYLAVSMNSFATSHPRLYLASAALLRFSPTASARESPPRVCAHRLPSFWRSRPKYCRHVSCTRTHARDTPMATGYSPPSPPPFPCARALLSTVLLPCLPSRFRQNSRRKRPVAARRSWERTPPGVFWLQRRRRSSRLTPPGWWRRREGQ